MRRLRLLAGVPLLAVALYALAAWAAPTVTTWTKGVFADGTVGAPGMGWANDQDTGFYRVAANTEAAVVGGAEVVRLTAGTVALKATAGTNTISSATTAAAASNSVAAFTLPTVALDADDLALNLKNNTTSIFKVDAEGDTVIPGRLSSVSSVAVATSGDGNAATATLNPAANVVLLSCNDTDGCTITMGETGAVSGTVVTIVAMTANASAFADSSGVSETTGTISLGQWDSLTLVYASDRWVEVSTSNN